MWEYFLGVVEEFLTSNVCVYIVVVNMCVSVVSERVSV